MPGVFMIITHRQVCVIKQPFIICVRICTVYLGNTRCTLPMHTCAQQLDLDYSVYHVYIHQLYIYTFVYHM